MDEIIKILLLMIQILIIAYGYGVIRQLREIKSLIKKLIEVHLSY